MEDTRKKCKEVLNEEYKKYYGKKRQIMKYKRIAKYSGISLTSLLGVLGASSAISGVVVIPLLIPGAVFSMCAVGTGLLSSYCNSTFSAHIKKYRHYIDNITSTRILINNSSADLKGIMSAYRVRKEEIKENIKPDDFLVKKFTKLDEIFDTVFSEKKEGTSNIYPQVSSCGQIQVQ